MIYYVMLYAYICVCVCVYIYIYIQSERERERAAGSRGAFSGDAEGPTLYERRARVDQAPSKLIGLSLLPEVVLFS